MRYQNRVGQEVINGAVDHDNFPFPTFSQVNPGAHPPGHVLTENNQILKAINMNKMQHQYIQNLQKANMTLKCKIKEISDLKVGQYDASTLRQIESMDEFNEESFEAPEETVEEIDDEFTLAELGTIEQMTQEAQTRKKEREARSKVREKERGFYDRNSIGRK